jgi:hypothetical protein
MVTWQTLVALTDGDVAAVGDGDVVLLVGVAVGDEHALA